MNSEDLMRVLKNEFQAFGDGMEVPSFRCAAYLRDGFYLPCVSFKASEGRVSLALRRFDETRADQEKSWLKGSKRFGKGMQYPDIVKAFVCSESQIAWHHIARIEWSPFALTLEKIMEIKGETSMSWTQFTCLMSDGAEFEFGTSWSRDFFAMPDGYSAADVVKVIPAERGTRPSVGQKVYREKPYFNCYVDEL